MQLLKRTSQPTAQQRGLGLPGNQTTYDIPNSAISWITVLYLVVNIVSTALSNFLSNKPQRDIDAVNMTLKKENFKFQTLQKCLEMDSLADRQSSLYLLLATDIFDKDEKTSIRDFTEKGKIPKWPKRPIEPLSSYLSGAGYSFSGGISSNPTPSNWGSSLQQNPKPDSIPPGGGSRPR